MPIDHNFDKFAIALSNAPGVFEKQVMRDLGQLIGTHYSRLATEKYMQEGPTTFKENKPPRPPGLGGPLRRVSQRLSRAVRGQFSDGQRESTTTLDVGAKGLVWTRIITVPYALIHEKGGTIQIPTTVAMESHFWKRWYQTGDDMWKYTALAAKSRSHFNINIPARPYSEPALNDLVPIIQEQGSQLIEQFIEDVLP